MKNRGRFIILLTGLAFLLSCTKGANPDGSTAVPNVSVSLSININTNPYTGLNTVGNVIYLTGVGYRGIMVYRLTTSTIVSYDRTCTYDISDNNGIVIAQTNGTAICPDCGSTYNLSNGSVNTGPTTIGLKQYTTTFNSVSGVVNISN